MSDLATLLPGIAAIITSLSGSFVAIWAVTRGSKRERRDAARGAVDRVLGAEEEDELAQLLEELKQHREEDKS